MEVGGGERFFTSASILLRKERAENITLWCQGIKEEKKSGSVSRRSRPLQEGAIDVLGAAVDEALDRRAAVRLQHRVQILGFLVSHQI